MSWNQTGGSAVYSEYQESHGYMVCDRPETKPQLIAPTRRRAKIDRRMVFAI